MTFSYTVRGIPELRAAFAAWRAKTGSTLEAADREAAAFTSGKARSRGSALGSVAAKAAPTVGASDRYLSFGGSGGYEMGAEFGATRYPQFKPWRGGPGGGYFVYPTIRDTEAERVRIYESEIDDDIRTFF